jgi:hypothetical protein
MTAPLLFIDTETTGLTADDEIWEVSLIRREPGGLEFNGTFQVAHDGRCLDLPDPFRTDHLARYDRGAALTRGEAAQRLGTFIDRSTHLVAANPAFDARFLTKLLGGSPWHYHLIDVEAMAVGYLFGRGWDPGRPGSDTYAPLVPWKSDDLSRLCGVEPPSRDERHTAQGDVLWVQRWFDMMTARRG